jgi:mono/diheme cytochrome c family protein
MDPRALYEQACAQCHGVSGQGDYYAPDFQMPAIAGAPARKVVHVLRRAGAHAPAFSAAVLRDASLPRLGDYVERTLAHPAEPAGRLGPRALDPFAVGVLVWGALALFLCALSWLFAEGRN